ncbi:UNVERIFIED_CONTAM: hypothetical protein RMT77_008855 [Armadillidium vulgare]
MKCTSYIIILLLLLYFAEFLGSNFVQALRHGFNFSYIRKRELQGNFGRNPIDVANPRSFQPVNGRMFTFNPKFNFEERLRKPIIIKQGEGQVETKPAERRAYG